jgi:hypothetical protein
MVKVPHLVQLSMKKILPCLVSLILLSLGVVGTAASAQEEQKATEPPMQGDNLQLLLGQRVESPAVVAMLNWAGLAPPTEEKPWSENSVFTLQFEHSRVSKIHINVDRWSTKPYWTAALPLGLYHEMKAKELDGSNDWRAGELDAYYTEMTRAWGDHELTGFKGSAHFNSQDKLRYLNMSCSPKLFWQDYSQLIRKMVPVSQFDANIWWGLIGADIASSGGDVLAAWAGIPIDGTVGEHGGLKVTLVDNRWLDKISLSPEFKGSFPFGLSNRPTEIELNAFLGGSIRNEGQASIARWAITSARQWPLYFDLDRTIEKEQRLILRCERDEVNTWMSTVTGQGAPSAALVDDIIFMWNSARKTPDALLGRKEVTEGLFREITTWYTNKCLLGVIGGTISDSGGDGFGDPTRRMEFLLRSYPLNSGELVEAQLDAFSKALKDRIGDEWKLSRTEASDKKDPKIQWVKKGLDFLEFAPELRIEVNTTDASTDLMLVILTPKM